VSQSNTTTTTAKWVSGGTAGQTYTVTNPITAAVERTDERSIIIRVEER